MSIISVRNLTKKFGDFTAVQDVSFEIAEGEVFAFLGPNGAGKTTTIKILTTLSRATKGEIFLNGFNIEKNPDEVRSSFGIVFQDQSLDDELTAYENMKFHGILYAVPKAELVRKIEYLLNFVGLLERKDDLVKQFSGGMKRRLEIARGLLHEPKVLFLDEPTIGLDPQTRNHIWSYVKNLSKKKSITVFFTTHYIEEAERMADRVAIIDQGKIVMIGTPEQLRKDAGVNTLEEAFIKLTGSGIRAENATVKDHMRSARKVWGR